MIALVLYLAILGWLGLSSVADRLINFFVLPHAIQDFFKKLALALLSVKHLATYKLDRLLVDLPAERLKLLLGMHMIGVSLQIVQALAFLRHFLTQTVNIWVFRLTHADIVPPGLIW
jgi:hypothetical protein